MIRVHDLESKTCLSSFPTVFYPSSIVKFDESNSFITTEYNQVNVWDIRASNPCVQRYQVCTI